MSDLELQQRNRQLAEWVTKLDKAMSKVADGDRASAYQELHGVRWAIELEAMATAGR
jgi:hypothetical protein